MFDGGVMMFYGVLMVVKGWFNHEHSGIHGIFHGGIMMIQWSFHVERMLRNVESLNH